MIATIAAMRLMAERTGRRGGEGAPEFGGADGVWRPGPWTYDDRNPYAARVLVTRRDTGEVFEGIAYWKMVAQYGPAGEDGVPQPAECWRDGGPHTLGKAAAADAYRKAFPEEIGGLYTTDEMRVSRRDGAALDEPPPKPKLAAGEQPRRDDGDESGVIINNVPVSPAAPVLPDDPKWAARFVDDTTPESRQRLELTLLELNVTPLAKARAVVDLLSHQCPRLFTNHFREFAALVIRAVRDNPGAYGADAA